MRRNTLRQMPKCPKFIYRRPEFLQLKTEDDLLVSADKQIRPIILPRGLSRLPWAAGYAECINAGKSFKNEDQAAFLQDVIVELSHSEQDSECPGLPWVYFGIFDGHAGEAVAVAAACQLDQIIKEKLRQVSDLLIALEFETSNDYYKDEDQDDGSDNERQNGDASMTMLAPGPDKPDRFIGQENHDSIDEPEEDKIPMELKDMTSEVETEVADKFDRQNVLLDFIPYHMKDKVDSDSLIRGALEAAFLEMDISIARDKNEYHMPGGCTAVVGVFILGRLFVCNAGDSRAIVVKGGMVIPMSRDFTPISDKHRILRLGMERPEFLGGEFTHLQFLRQPTRHDLGKRMLYRDASMSGWSMKTITSDDLKFPLVWGQGKRSRCLGTIGVSRGFGDHELRAILGSVPIKPFLTAEPEVRVLHLEDDESLTPEDVLIMGTDGLWDVCSNIEAADIVGESFKNLFSENEDSRSRYRYITAAQDLVLHSRGNPTSWSHWQLEGTFQMASMDDISVFVVPLKPYRDEYLEWRRVRLLARQKCKSHHEATDQATNDPKPS